MSTNALERNASHYRKADDNRKGNDSKETYKSKLSYSSRMRSTKRHFENAYLPWERADDELLDQLFSEGCSIIRLSKIFKRNPGAIQARIRKLHLAEKYRE